MPDTQKRNDEMSALLTADLLSSDDRNVAFAAYDAVGHVFTTVETHNMATVILNTAPTVFQWASGILTLPEAGLYWLSFHATMLKVGTTAVADGSAWLEQDPATGVWATLPAISGDTSLPITGRANVAWSTIVRAGNGYRYRVRVARNSGADSLGLATNGSSLNVMRLFRNR